MGRKWWQMFSACFCAVVVATLIHDFGSVLGAAFTR